MLKKKITDADITMINLIIKEPRIIENETKRNTWPKLTKEYKRITGHKLTSNKMRMIWEVFYWTLLVNIRKFKGCIAQGKVDEADSYRPNDLQSLVFNAYPKIWNYTLPCYSECFDSQLLPQIQQNFVNGKESKAQNGHNSITEVLGAHNSSPLVPCYKNSELQYCKTTNTKASTDVFNFVDPESTCLDSFRVPLSQKGHKSITEELGAHNSSPLVPCSKNSDPQYCKTTSAKGRADVFKSVDPQSTCLDSFRVPLCQKGHKSITEELGAHNSSPLVPCSNNSDPQYCKTTSAKGRVDVFKSVDPQSTCLDSFRVPISAPFLDVVSDPSNGHTVQKSPFNSQSLIDQTNLWIDHSDIRNEEAAKILASKPPEDLVPEDDSILLSDEIFLNKNVIRNLENEYLSVEFNDSTIQKDIRDEDIQVLLLNWLVMILNEDLSNGEKVSIDSKVWQSLSKKFSKAGVKLTHTQILEIWEDMLDRTNHNINLLNSDVSVTSEMTWMFTLYFPYLISRKKPRASKTHSNGIFTESERSSESNLVNVPGLQNEIESLILNCDNTVDEFIDISQFMFVTPDQTISNTEKSTQEDCRTPIRASDSIVPAKVGSFQINNNENVGLPVTLEEFNSSSVSVIKLAGRDVKKGSQRVDSEEVKQCSILKPTSFWKRKYDNDSINESLHSTKKFKSRADVF